MSIRWINIRRDRQKPRTINNTITVSLRVAQAAYNKHVRTFIIAFFFFHFFYYSSLPSQLIIDNSNKTRKKGRERILKCRCFHRHCRCSWGAFEKSKNHQRRKEERHSCIEDGNAGKKEEKNKDDNVRSPLNNKTHQWIFTSRKWNESRFRVFSLVEYEFENRSK